MLCVSSSQCPYYKSSSNSIGTSSKPTEFSLRVRPLRVFLQVVEKQCREQAFSLMCDGGGDLGSEHKDFAILVLLYDKSLAQVTTRFLDMAACDSATGEPMYLKIVDILE